MTSPPVVRVVVVHFGDPGLTLRCLGALAALTWPIERLDVVVVDNDPAPLDGRAVEAARSGSVVLRPGSNLGFAGGVNVGLRSGAVRRFDLVALLNNDAVPEPGWLEPLVAALGDEARLGAACSKVLLEDPPGTVNSAGLRLVEHGFGADRGYLEPDLGQYDDVAEVFGWSGSAVLLRDAYLDDVGLLDERYFAYYEDVDLSWRGRLRGWGCRYVPTSVVRHRHAAGLGIESERFRFLDARNRLLTLAKLAPARMALRALAVEVKLAVVDRPGGLRRHGRVLASAAWWLPGVLADRVRVRRRRLVTDREVLRWMTPP